VVLTILKGHITCILNGARLMKNCQSGLSSKDIQGHNLKQQKLDGKDSKPKTRSAALM
jgi:hypothetical protein